MGQILTPSLAYSFATKIRRVRELPVAGEITVSSGRQVTAQAIVARAELPGDLEIVRVSERLGIEPFEVVAGLRVKTGDHVVQNAPLCEHQGLWGLFRSTLNSPASGEVEFIAERTGHIGIRLQSRAIELRAYVSGTVVEIVPHKSVVIEAEGAFVQGIFGVGGERLGRIQILEVGSGDAVTAEAIPVDCNGTVLVGGLLPTIQALRVAQQRGATGFVTGSIDDGVLKEYVGYDVGVAVTGDEEVSMSVIVTEGFGRISIAERTLALLRQFAGEEASINGATQVRAGALRPEIIIPHQRPASGTAVKAVGLEVGVTVRLIRYPYFGERAEVIELPSKPQQIATGAHARVLRARLASGEIVTVPRANVELF